MNSAILFFIACVATVTIFVEGYGVPFEENLQIWTEQCLSETEADPELIEAERSGMDINNSKVKCFHACMAIKMKLMSYDGRIHKERIINFIPHYISDEQKMEIIAQRAMCVELVGENPCETADLILKCVRPATTKYTSPNDHEKNVYYFFSVKRT